MSYKTILVHVDHSAHAAARIEVAARLARSSEAHLVGAAMTGIAHFFEGDALANGWPVMSADIASLTERADHALANFDAIAASVGVLSYERRLLNDSIEGGLVLQSRYADLVVVSQTDPMQGAFRNQWFDLPAYLMLNCARPLLLIPHGSAVGRFGDRVLLAWDGSAQATRAATSAIPLLRRAGIVTLAVFNSAQHASAHGEQPGADLALYLARHGVQVSVVVRDTGSGDDVGLALLALAAERHCDLMVMGGYGHTRFHEVLLGGVTQTVLTTMATPVLMSH